jgi:hypothetical protein
MLVFLQGRQSVEGAGCELSGVLLELLNAVGKWGVSRCQSRYIVRHTFKVRESAAVIYHRGFHLLPVVIA